MKHILASAVAALTICTAFPTMAQTLNFSGLNGNASERVRDYYAGGAGSAGSTGGPNYGITFSETATSCSVAPAGICDAAQLPTGGNMIYFGGGGNALMNVAGGFSTGLSFYYSAAFTPGVVRVYSGLDGSGSLLATLILSTTPNGSAAPGCYGTHYCPFIPTGISFAGVAQSVDFSGAMNTVAFTNITINSATPGGVPEPTYWALLICGFGMAGAGMRARGARASGL